MIKICLWLKISLKLSLPILQAHSPGSEDQESWNPTHVGDSSVKTNDGHGGVASTSETGSINRLASIDSFDSKWYVPGVILALRSYFVRCSCRSFAQQDDDFLKLIYQLFLSTFSFTSKMNSY